MSQSKTMGALLLPLCLLGACTGKPSTDKSANVQTKSASLRARSFDPKKKPVPILPQQIQALRSKQQIKNKKMQQLKEIHQRFLLARQSKQKKLKERMMQQAIRIKSKIKGKSAPKAKN